MDKIDVIGKTISLSDIQTISRQCIDLLSTTESLRSINEDAFKNAEMLFSSLRKLFIASMMHNRRLICISGLQGAGKTTLMKNFYGITDDFMNVSLGTGERVPVLITEGAVSEPNIHAIAVRKDEDGNYKEIPINYENDDIEGIIHATKGEDKTIMYVEIVVPYKHTYNEGVSFMLLPGFEKNNDYWNDLIEFSVNSSDAAVFVFNETSFSNAGNEDYLRKIESKFGSNVIYAISGSDSSLDDNAQVKKTCMEVLKVKEPDKVVCIGQYSDVEKNNFWITAFKTALDKYALYETQVTQKTTSYIYNELLNIKDTLYTILGSLNESEDFEETDYKNHKMLKAYDKAILKQRKELARHITEEFAEAKGRSVDSIANQLDNKPWYKSLKKTFFGENVKEYYIETQNIIKSSLLKDGGICLPDLYLGYAFQETMKFLDQPQNSNPNALQLLVDTEETEDNKTTLILSNDTQNAIDDVCALIEVPKKNEQHREIKSSNPNRLLKAVAEIATYYYGFTSYNSLAKTFELASYEGAKSHLTGDDIIKGADSSKKFAVGLAGVMGVDILGDGSLNLVSQIATSCGVSLPIAGAAAVLIVGAGALRAVISDINRMQRADFESAKMTVLSIYDNIQREALERFDNFTNEVRDRIEDNLADLGGERKNIITIYNAIVEVNNLKDFLNDLTKDYLEQSHDIGSFIS